MNTKRIVFRFKLHEDKVEDYVRIHDNIPDELVALYKECGILNISCFLSGQYVICYQEFNMDIYPHKKHLIEQSEISKQFGALLAPTEDKSELIPDDNYVECYLMK